MISVTVHLEWNQTMVVKIVLTNHNSLLSEVSEFDKRVFNIN